MKRCCFDCGDEIQDKGRKYCKTCREERKERARLSRLSKVSVLEDPRNQYFLKAK
jgi:hypothetical protein